jgi:hypothetical protein
MPDLDEVEIGPAGGQRGDGVGGSGAGRDLRGSQRAAEMRLAGKRRGDMDLAGDSRHGQRAGGRRAAIDIELRAIGREGADKMCPAPGRQ